MVVEIEGAGKAFGVVVDGCSTADRSPGKVKGNTIGPSSVGGTVGEGGGRVVVDECAVSVRIPRKVEKSCTSRTCSVGGSEGEEGGR